MQRVAIKVIDPKLADDALTVRRFMNEARAVAHIDHPGIVKLYGLGTHDGQPYMVMEYLEAAPGQPAHAVYRVKHSM